MDFIVNWVQSHNLNVDEVRMDLSVIYPVHITFQTRYILKRIQRCLSNTTQGLPDAKHLIALSGKPRYIKKAKQIIGESKLPVKVVEYATPTNPYSPGIARNFAVKHASQKHLLFWDIDLLGNSELFQAIPQHIKEIQQDTNIFHMYPCLYLCNTYTKHFKNDFEQLWLDATQLKTNTIEHFAMATSTILCDKQHFLDIGTFDEEFVGHMGEDLELLNRLSIAYGKYPFEHDHCEDWPSKVPAELKGFRKQFALYGLENLKSNLFTCHLNHSTRLYTPYKNSNTKNRNLLLKKIKNQNNNFASKVTTFKFPIYLTKKHKITLTQTQTTTRKLRKLVFNPIHFFKDIK